MTVAQEKKAAKKEITKSIRDLLNFKITVPLGNPSYKLLHTNQFITTQLPPDFVLENFGIIGQKLASEATRSTTYVTNRWYVESITITNNGKDAKMELELNPFASPRTQYKDNYASFSKAYQDATKSTASSSSTAKTTTTKKDTKKSIQQALDEVGHLMEKKKYKRHTFSDYKNFVKYGYGDCWAGAYFVACQLQKRGVKARILDYPTSQSSHHRSVQYKNAKGKWVPFPYKNYKIHSYFRTYSTKGRVIKNNCPKNL
jgi:hypothetical protein